MTAVQDPDPTVQRRRLRQELRRARVSAGLRQAEVAEAMDWSPSKIIRIERGDVSVSTNDLRVLLGYYQVADENRVSELIELARSTRGSSFYDQYSDLLKPGFKEYLSYEAYASVIRQYDPILVPGLLQTESYARGLFESHGFDRDKANRLWDLRRHRQEVHTRDQPPEMQFVLDEAALRRRVGKEDAMLHQLKQLIELAARKYIKIQILPFARGAHPGLDGNFIVLEFADPDLDNLVHLELINQITIKDDFDMISLYQERFEQLKELALSREESVEFLGQLIEDLGSSPQSKNSASGEAV